MKQIIFLSIILSGLLCLIDDGKVLADESIDVSITPRIIGGADANIKNFPYTVSLRFHGEYFCVGCSISEEDILTAAHCFFAFPNLRPPYLDITIHAGTNSSQRIGKVYPVKRVTLHPDFVFSWEMSGNHDLAHVKVDGKMEFGENQYKVDLPRNHFANFIIATVTGWGIADPNTGVISEKLQQLKMRVVDYLQCQGFSEKIYPEQLCAYQHKGYGCAKGDSGGPLVADNNEVIGIHSWTIDGTCAVGLPEVFTNVFAEKAFIEAAIAGTPYRSSSKSEGKTNRYDSCSSDAKEKGKAKRYKP